MENEKAALQKGPSLLEKAFGILVLFFSTGALITLIQKESGIIYDPVQGNMVMQLLWLCVYGVVFLLLLRHFKLSMQIAFTEKILWFLIGAAVISIFWSEVPAVTLRRSIALLGTTGLGVYLAVRFKNEELLKLLAWTTGLIIVLSIGFIFLLPAYGIQEGTMWRGIYENKNGLGCIMALSAIVWMLCVFNRLVNPYVGCIFMTISIILLAMTNSIASIIIFFILLSVILFYFIINNLKSKGFLAAFCGVVTLAGGGIAAWAAYNYDAVLTVLGRDSSFSGRIGLWKAVWGCIQEQPWLGYGYSGVWTGTEGISGKICQVLPWVPNHAHNGYLDLLLQLGVAGMVIFIISISVNVYKAHYLARSNGNLVEIFPILFFVFLIIHNIAESNILYRNSIFWVLYVYFSIQLSMNFKNRDKES